MKNFENQITNENLIAPEAVITQNNNPVSIDSDHRKSTFEMMGDSCHDYSSRVWNVVKSDMDDHYKDVITNNFK